MRFIGYHSLDTIQLHMKLLQKVPTKSVALANCLRVPSWDRVKLSALRTLKKTGERKSSLSILFHTKSDESGRDTQILRQTEGLENKSANRRMIRVIFQELLGKTFSFSQLERRSANAAGLKGLLGPWTCRMARSSESVLFIWDSERIPSNRQTGKQLESSPANALRITGHHLITSDMLEIVRSRRLSIDDFHWNSLTFIFRHRN